VIVSNAGPLIVLLKTGKISILKGLFQKVLVPMTVWEEITAKDYEKSIFVKMEWIETKKIRNTELAILLEKLIGKGEAEAIVLAKELRAVLLMDDAKARKHAKLLNIEVIGTLGLLKLAKNRGLISSVKEVIDKMLAKGYYIEDSLIKKILKEANEL
jgi:predicted nucleic acid-binding protein